MSDDYEERLRQQVEQRERGTWREILRRRYGPWMEPLDLGFQCHDGWRGLIEAALFEVSEIVGGPEGATDVRVVQIKEKFGTLKIYVWHVPKQHREAVQAVVDRAEELSAGVCEVCGQPGRLIDSVGYWHTACPEHEDPPRGY